MTRQDLSLIADTAAVHRVTLARTLADGSTGRYDLTGATLTFRVELSPTTSVTYTEGAGITVIGPRTDGVLDVRLDGDNFPTPGTYPYTLTVLAAGADDPDTPLHGNVVVSAPADLGLVGVASFLSPSELRCTPAIAGDGAKAIAVASVILHVLSGYRVGTRVVTVRPVRLGTVCSGLAPTPGAHASGTPREWPLPGPVASVVGVTLDGVALATWALVGDSIYRSDSSWPADQDLSKATSEAGTWSVTYVRGVEPDEAASQAANDLACELVKGWEGGDCRLPQRVTTITRQGVTVALTDPMDLFDKGRTGIASVDLWLASVNPHNQRRGASVAYPGAKTTRRIA